MLHINQPEKIVYEYASLFSIYFHRRIKVEELQFRIAMTSKVIHYISDRRWQTIDSLVLKIIFEEWKLAVDNLVAFYFIK